MTAPTTADGGSDAVDVLGAFGVADPVAALEDAGGGDSNGVVDPGGVRAGVRVREALAHSGRGIDAPRRYWNRAPVHHLQNAVDAVGYDCSVEPCCDDVDYRVVLRTGDGRRRRLRFAYPDTPLGVDNYPALAYAVETRLLFDAGVTFVRLADDRRWQFALVERDRLASLRCEYGDRVCVDEQPVLARRQPVAFVDDGTHRPRTREVGSGTSGAPTDPDVAIETVVRATATGSPRPVPGDGGVDDGPVTAFGPVPVDEPGAGDGVDERTGRFGRLTETVRNLL